MRVSNFHRLLAGLVGCTLSLGLIADRNLYGADGDNPLAGPAGPATPAPTVTAPAGGAGAANPAAGAVEAPAAPDADNAKHKKGKKKEEAALAAGGQAGAANAGPAEGAPAKPGAGAAAAHQALPPQVRDQLSRLTVIDQASIELANISQADGKTEDAAACLKAIYDGKDNDACGAAHLLEAFWQIRDNKNAEAEANLVQVTGPFADSAAHEIARINKDDPTHMQANFDTLIQNLKGDKNLAYKGRVIEFAIQQARAANLPDLLVSTLKKVSTWTNPDEALKIRDAMDAQLIADYDRNQKMQEMRAQHMAGAAVQAAQAGEPAGEPGAGVPPGRGKRAEAGAAAAAPGAGAPGAEGGPTKEKVLEMMKQRADKLRADGDADRAAKVEAMMEKIKNGEITPEELKKRAEERQAGNGPAGAAGQPGGPGPGGPGGHKGKKAGEAAPGGDGANNPGPQDEAAF